MQTFEKKVCKQSGSQHLKGGDQLKRQNNVRVFFGIVQIWKFIHTHTHTQGSTQDKIIIFKRRKLKIGIVINLMYFSGPDLVFAIFQFFVANLGRFKVNKIVFHMPLTLKRNIENRKISKNKVCV